MIEFKSGDILKTDAEALVINFPTKRHWRGKSRLDDIESGLRALVREVEMKDIRSIALPPLGAGLGGLDWQDVRSRIESELQALGGVHVTVFEPRVEATAFVNRSTKVPNT